MPSLIHRLNETLINQIAAGEVIEQPASVVKEIVENSLDAKATSIFIEVKGGGRQLIRITDNGMGMGKEDAVLCFERHATSKVAAMEDFEQLYSMGFRGEALASIASIAKVSLKTRPAEHELGSLVQIEGGSLISVSSIPCDAGTCIEIADLFYNVPARKKFLKSPAQEEQEIQKMVVQLALANRHVLFKLIVDKELIVDASPNDSLHERGRQLLHPEMVDQMKPISFSEGEFQLEGLIGSPTQHRPNRTGQSLFVNQRAVVSWAISQAVLDGFSTLLPERRFPLFVLYLSVPPSFVDVNVHPQKKEVRFRHEGMLKDFIRKGIAKQWEIPTPKFVPVFQEKTEVWSSPAPLKREIIYEPVVTIEKTVHEPAAITFFENKTFEQPLPNVLGIISSYILLDAFPLSDKEGEGFCVLDAKSARERIIYEKVLAGLTGKTVEKQTLLLPLTFDLTSDEIFHLTHLEPLGFTIRQSTKSSCLIEAIPAFLKESEVEGVLKTLLEGFTENQDMDWSKRLALRASSRVPGKIDREQAKALIKTVLECQQPYFSPRGQPTFAWIKAEELSRYFK